MKGKKEYFVRDLVIDDEYSTISSEKSVVEAAKKMKELGIPDLVVQETDKSVLGVVGDFDIVKNVVAAGMDPSKTSVKEAMYLIDPVTTDSTVAEAFSRMTDLNVNVIPVVEKGKLLGVASVQDCWGYIPEENPDNIGLIKVKQPKLAEFWFTSVTGIIALVFGVLMPFTGTFPYFNGEGLSSIFGSLELGSEAIGFYGFSAHGRGFFINYAEMINRGGILWVFVLAIGVLFLIASIIGILSLIFSAYGDFAGFHTPLLFRTILPLSAIVLTIIQWLVLGIGLNFVKEGGTISLNAATLVFSIVSVLFILAGMFRDIVFKDSTNSSSEEA